MPGPDQVVQAFSMALALASLGILAAGVASMVLGAWMVDRTVEAHEAVLLIGLVIGSLVGIIVLAGTVLMALPPVACLAGVVWWKWRQRRSVREWQHRIANEDEARARAILARDPTAEVAYEKLADLLIAAARDDEALEVLRAWAERRPQDRGWQRRTKEVEERVAQRAATVSVPEPPPQPQRRIRRGGR